VLARARTDVRVGRMGKTLSQWNMGSFESTSVCAGEVADAGSVFPKAIFITLLVVLANYIFPIMAFSGLDGNFANYDNGHYISVARAVGGSYLGAALGAAQSAAVAGLFVNGLVTNTYLICGMSEQVLYVVCVL
jgi:amino acid transporter